MDERTMIEKLKTAAAILSFPKETELARNLREIAAHLKERIEKENHPDWIPGFNSMEGT